MKQKPVWLAAFCWLAFLPLVAQWRQVDIYNSLTGEPVPYAAIRDSAGTFSRIADIQGRFTLPEAAPAILFISATGYREYRWQVSGTDRFRVLLDPVQRELEGIVVSGTLKAVSRSESPVAVEVYSARFLKKNPSPSIFESLQQVNGVRPQINCSVCNTGDIHINGLEGPYTLVAVDGMPVMSSLASVYGLFGIPLQLIDRVEIVKGPAAALYGAEAIGGLINIITKSPEKGPRFSGQWMSNNRSGHSLDAGYSFKAGKKARVLLGLHGFRDQTPEDRNRDGFTDIALQQRVSVFNKWGFQREKNREASIAARYFYEDRWGGQLHWNTGFRGGDSVYGESIKTSRWELFGVYQLPVHEKMNVQYSLTGHHQDSYYGLVPYIARQRTFFAQLTREHQAGKLHKLLAGLTVRGQQYDDNSTATRDTLTGENRPENVWQPGLFIQDEWQLHPRHLVLLGYRADIHPVHGWISTPRIAWKWKINEDEVIRINAGTGFRVVSLFTEEHAALSGARVVEIREKIRPERSANINVNYTREYRFSRFSLRTDLSAWYSRFSNQIIPDYTSDPFRIIYANLPGYARSAGVTANVEMDLRRRFSAVMGITLLDMRKINTLSGRKIREQPVLTEKWSGTWTVSWRDPGAGWIVDYTGAVYGPMLVPLSGPLDPRPDVSPVWSLQHLQLTKRAGKVIEVFTGVKNLLNWTPARNIPFLIARAHDPFNKNVQYESDGTVKTTADNPFALRFDPSYVYAPNQGRQFYFGLRIQWQ